MTEESNGRRDLVAEESRFPLEAFKDAAQHLRRPFTSGAVKWKVEKVGGSKGMVVSYIDARLVFERLNLVLPHLWSDRFQRVDGLWVECFLTVDGIERSDVGTGNDLKAARSDAAKRAGVHFGIGVANYAMRETWLQATREPKSNELLDTGRKSKNGKPIYEIPANTETWLRGIYQSWLDLPDRGGIFGPPLDHGDDPEGSVGELAEVEQSDQTDQLPLEDNGHREELIGEARDLYTELKAVDGRKLTQGKFDAMLAAARSDADLKKIGDFVRVKLEEAEAKA